MDFADIGIFKSLSKSKLAHSELDLREDEAGETLDNQTIMNLCRSGEYGYIVVPAVPAALENSEHQAKKISK